jgi:hypothetical protein
MNTVRYKSVAKTVRREIGSREVKLVVWNSFYLSFIKKLRFMFLYEYFSLLFHFLFK